MNDLIIEVIFVLSFTACLSAVIFCVMYVFEKFVSPSLASERKKIRKLCELTDLEPGRRLLQFAAFFGPLSRFVLGIVRKRRIAAASAQFPDALVLLAGALRAGVSLPQAIEMAAGELTPPLGREFGRVAAGLRMGRTVEDALEIFAMRLPTEDVGLFFQSISVLRRTGGNLIQTFETLSQTVAERRRVEERVRVLTAQGIYQGALLVAMPWLLGFMLYLISPEYISPLFGTNLGMFFVAVGIFLEVAGALWLKKIVMIKV